LDQVPVLTLRPLALLAVPFALTLTGCRGHVVANAQAKAEQRAQTSEERQELDQIPPPSKNRYMAVHSFDTWENPSITVQPDMLSVHILLADANPSSYGSGGMLRPIGARRQEVNISLDKLGEAMSAIPQSAWPYGRVVAVEEAHQTPGKQEPTVRRNMEAAVSTLNDLGIIAYDINSGSLR
jgi:hypothetical protein